MNTNAETEGPICTTFNQANLQGAHFNNAVLTEANFEGANLSKVNFMGADLRGAKLRNAKLKNIMLGGFTQFFDYNPIPKGFPNGQEAYLTIPDQLVIDLFMDLYFSHTTKIQAFCAQKLPRGFAFFPGMSLAFIATNSKHREVSFLKSIKKYNSSYQILLLLQFAQQNPGSNIKAALDDLIEGGLKIYHVKTLDDSKSQLPVPAKFSCGHDQHSDDHETVMDLLNDREMPLKDACQHLKKLRMTCLTYCFEQIETFNPGDDICFINTGDDKFVLVQRDSAFTHKASSPTPSTG